VKFWKKPERYEEVALELILSVIKTGRPLVDIDKARMRYAQMGNAELAELVSRVYMLLEGGASVIDAFYSASMLSVETYSLLKVAEDSSSLTEGFVRDLITAKREKESAKGKVRSAIVTPLVMIVAVSFAGATIIAKLMQVISSIQIQGRKIYVPFESVYLAIAQSPLLGGLALAGIFSVLFVFLVGLWFRRSGSKEMKLMIASRLLALLRRQEVPYAKIFRTLASFERDKKLRRAYNLVAEQSEILQIQEALRPLLPHLPVTVSVVLSSMIERGDEVEAWLYVNEQMRVIFDSKMVLFEKNAPMLGNFMFLLIMMFSMYPVKAVFSALSQLGM